MEQQQECVCALKIDPTVVIVNRKQGALWQITTRLDGNILASTQYTSLDEDMDLNTNQTQPYTRSTKTIQHHARQYSTSTPKHEHNRILTAFRTPLVAPCPFPVNQPSLVFDGQQ